MNIQGFTRFGVTGIALAVAALSSPVYADTASQNVVEARQESQIWTTYALSPHLRANDLKVSVDGSKATLTGKVEESVSKELAQQIALGVEGIKDVDNQIVVQADYQPAAPTADRSYGDRVDDATITASVKSRLAWSKHTDAMTTQVETERGKVTLKGPVESTAARDLAGRLAMNTRGVTSVDNQLQVTAGKAGVGDTVKTSGKEMGMSFADGWITTKVKSTFMSSSDVDGSDISVKTLAGVVTLSGKVDGGAERALAIELAKNVKGVKSVESKGLTI